jgi:Kef-type K+ transport system membrane component KefB/Trk K+ transport system NAD-binding subunit
MGEAFVQLGVVVGLAVLISFLMKALRQPLIIGYIITGIIAGPSILRIVGPGSSLEIFASLGVALLLFIVGLGLNPEMVRDVGKVSVITGIAQVAFTALFGFIIAVLLDFSIASALYIAVAFTFSSTIIILRLLYEKEDEESLYGRIAIGFLLVQDLIAMVIFIFLSSVEGPVSDSVIVTIGWVLLKVMILGFLLYLVWRFVIPLVDSFVADNRQVLFIFAIALCFILASVFDLFGFSLELGALVAGILLSSSPYHRELASRIQPLRDFFLVIFFIFLGTHMAIGSILAHWVAIIVFSLFILIGNPLIVLLIMTRLGHTRKTAFYSGLTVAQISEFSLIMIGIGISVGHIPGSILALGTSVGLITIALSSYMITYNEQIYKFLEPFLKMLTPYATDHETIKEISADSFELILFGGHRSGGGIIETLQRRKNSFLVIDHDPRLVKRLRQQSIPVLFGDASDATFLDELNFTDTKMVISTIPDINVNSFLLQYFHSIDKKIQVICLANHRHHAQRLYKEGAAYVVMPFYIGRRFMVDLFKKNLFSETKYKADKKRHLLDLKHLKHSH